MLRLDEFESAFKSADKQRYSYSPVDISSVLVFTDLPREQARHFSSDVRDYLTVLERADLSWREVAGDEFDDAGELLAIVERERPDLICAYRNLHGGARRFPFSLGAHVDVLTQATTTPVLLLPAPTDEGRLSPGTRDTDSVMVLHDQLTGSDSIVNYGVRFTTPGGRLLLAHLENDHVFQRYMDVIAKLPSIDTERARVDIAAQLLKEPSDYIASAKAEIEAHELPLEVHPVVTMGHQIADCKRLVEENAIDMIVMNTKDDEQLAMHGLAYPIAVELRDVPLLML
jgi:nucleotide-binding universal stress UspA family protein